MGFRCQVDGTRSDKILLFCFTDTTLIDRPIDSVAFIHLLLVCRSFIVSSSFVCLSLALYILKSGVSLQGYQPIVTWLFGPDESRQRGCRWFLSWLSFVLIRISARTRRLLRLQRFLIHAAIDNRFFSVYTTIIIVIFICRISM